VLPPDIAKLLPKGRLLSEVRFPISILARDGRGTLHAGDTDALSMSQSRACVKFFPSFPLSAGVCLASSRVLIRHPSQDPGADPTSPRSSCTPGGVARSRRAAITRLGALRHPQAGAPHHAVPVRALQIRKQHFTRAFSNATWRRRDGSRRVAPAMTAGGDSR
jgi:hypothetical protein